MQRKKIMYFTGAVFSALIFANGFFPIGVEAVPRCEKGTIQQVEHQKPVFERQEKKAAPTVTVPVSYEVPILGAAEIPPQKMVQYIRRHNAVPQIQCSLEELVNYYYEEAGKEGVRADIALCQAIKETGFFAYGGDVVSAQNNYCGLGATGHGEPGAYFATPQRGVRAHIQHLMAYATTRLPQTPIIDPRYEVLRQKYPAFYGQIHNWTGLNGKWAVPGTHYGEEILAIWQEVKSL